METHKFRRYLCLSMGWLKGGGVEDTVKNKSFTDKFERQHKFAGVGSMEDIPCCRHRGAAPETMCRAVRRIL